MGKDIFEEDFLTTNWMKLAIFIIFHPFRIMF